MKKTAILLLTYVIISLQAVYAEDMSIEEALKLYGNTYSIIECDEIIDDTIRIKTNESKKLNVKKFLVDVNFESKTEIDIESIFYVIDNEKLVTMDENGILRAGDITGKTIIRIVGDDLILTADIIIYGEELYTISGEKALSIYDIPVGTTVQYGDDNKFIEYDGILDDRYYPYYTEDGKGIDGYIVEDIYGNEYEILIITNSDETLPTTKLIFQPTYDWIIYQTNIWDNYSDYVIEETVGEYITLPECPFQKEGYTFVEWNIRGKAYKPGDLFYVPYMEDENELWINAEWDYASDVDLDFDLANHWSNQYCKFVKERGLMSNTIWGIFNPDHPMDREGFVIALAKLSGVEDNYVDWAINIGLLQGYGNSEYGLDDTITREQMAVFFERYMTLAKIDIESLKTVENTVFADDSSIADWSKSSVYTMQAMKLIQGKNNNIFDPQGLTTRAEAATVLYNLITVTGK